jgi:hypothetical protein
MTAPIGERRDPELAQLLRASLDAPPLPPGFHDELETRLTAADAARPHSESGTAVGRRRRFAGRRLFAAAAVAAAAAVFAFAVLPALRGSDTATAADILAAMTSSSGGAESVRLHLVSHLTSDWQSESVPRQRDRQTETLDLTMDVDGSALASLTRQLSSRTGDEAWVRYPAYSSVDGYDAMHHEQRVGWSTADAGRQTALANQRFTIRRPAWAAETPASDLVALDYDTLAECLRAGLAEGDPEMPVEDTTYLGRPAWRAELVERWPPFWARDVEVLVRYDVVVDKSTGLLMAADYRMESGGDLAPLRLALRVTRMEIDPALEDGWQVVPVPARGRVAVVDEGTRFGTPEQVAERSWPTLPLVPEWVPEGYRLTAVASAGVSAVPSGSTEPWSRGEGSAQVVGRAGRFVRGTLDWTMPDQAVLVRFRRGFDSFVVQITPKAFGEEIRDEADGTGDAQDVTLSGGYLKGARARTWIAPYQGLGPRLLTYSIRSQVVIWGDLTRQELIDVANSMKAYGDQEKPPALGAQD